METKVKIPKYLDTCAYEIVLRCPYCQKNIAVVDMKDEQLIYVKSVEWRNEIAVVKSTDEWAEPKIIPCLHCKMPVLIKEYEVDP